MTMEEIQNSVIEDFAELTDPLSRAEYVIACARQAEPFPKALHTYDALVPDCQSNTWVVTKWESGILHFLVDSESFLVKGMLTLIREIYEGRTHQEVESFSCVLPDLPAVEELLTPEQRKGIRSILTLLSGRNDR